MKSKQNRLIPVVGADFLAALVANYFLGALPPNIKDLYYIVSIVYD